MQRTEPPRPGLSSHANRCAFAVIGEHDLLTARRANAVAQQRLRAALHEHRGSGVKIMSRVLDRLDRESGVLAAARLLVAWRGAGGLRTREFGAAGLHDVCAIADRAVRAHDRFVYLTRVLQAA